MLKANLRSRCLIVVAVVIAVAAISVIVVVSLPLLKVVMRYVSIVLKCFKCSENWALQTIQFAV